MEKGVKMTTHNTESAKDLIITEENFKEYFFDVRLNKPQRGQVMASYTAVAEFCDGPEKKQIIEILQKSSKIEAALQIVRRVLLAKEQYVYIIVREMLEDLLNGMSVEEVCQKPYRFVCEMFFWTKPEYIPASDPHWACVSILNMNEHFEQQEKTPGPVISSKVIMPERQDT